MRKLTKLMFSLFAWSLAMSLHATETVIHYTPLEDASDKRLEWPMAVLNLALTKTQAQYGPYRFAPIPQAISLARSVLELNQDTHPNYFFPGGPNIARMSNDNLITLDYPLDQGMLSYRICFVSPAAKEKVAAAKNLEDLRKFTIGQGNNWPDVTILEKNGFRVQQVPNYLSLFKMVMSSRIDLFCRGISELRREHIAYKHLGNLIYDQSFVLVYAIPYSLYFNKNSGPLVQRLEEGLKIAQKDGSLRELFIKHHREDILFAKLKDRKIIQLRSPFDQPQPASFKSFIIDPLTIE